MRHIDDFIPAEDVFPEAFDAVKGPAIALRGLRYRQDMTQKQLADKIGVLQHHLSEMENGKRPIGKAMAKKLAAALKANWWVVGVGIWNYKLIKLYTPKPVSYHCYRAFYRYVQNIRRSQNAKSH